MNATSKSKNQRPSLRLAIAGATGTVGLGIVDSVLERDDVELAAIITRDPNSHRMQRLRERIPASVLIANEVTDELAGRADLLIDYTHPSTAPINALAAIKVGMSVVIGTSGLSEDDLSSLEAEATRAGVGVVAASNFSLTAILMKRAALDMARYLGNVEIIEYASPRKADAPSGTAIDLANAISRSQDGTMKKAASQSLGDNRSRGAPVGGIPVHALRLDSYYHSVEVIFGESAERLTLRHDAINGGEPYARGTLLAAHAALTFTGLKRGIAEILSPDDLV